MADPAAALRAGEPVSGPGTALEGFRRLRRRPDAPVCFLHSARHDLRWGRFSLLALPESVLQIDAAEPDPRPFHTLMAHAAGDEAVWIGYAGYDLGFRVEPTGRARLIAPSDWPELWFGRCPGWLLHDAATGGWTAGGTWRGGFPGWTNQPDDPPVGAAVAPDRARARHEAAVRAGVDAIAAGDLFQVNLAQRFSGRFNGDPAALYARLCAASPNLYAAHLDLGQGRSLLSSSPELFLALTPEGHVTTRPIKGTGAVGGSDLAASAKDAAELAMIVDLLRNDLGRVCRTGSISVDEARALEAHAAVEHGVATVTGELRVDAGLADLLHATFPGGSITGAPKVRAMQIIDALEPVPRGPYCGIAGYIAPGRGACGGGACFNILIRTLLLDRGDVNFSVGGGIVADSDPAAEYDETLLKATGMLQALGADACTPCG